MGAGVSVGLSVGLLVGLLVGVLVGLPVVMITPDCVPAPPGSVVDDPGFWVVLQSSLDQGLLITPPLPGGVRVGVAVGVGVGLPVVICTVSKGKLLAPTVISCVPSDISSGGI